MRLFIAAAAAVAFAIPAGADDKVALTNDNTKITWVGTKGAAGKHQGGFKAVKGAAVVAGGTLTKVAVEIETESLYSDDEKLTAHLKSPDFFGVKTNPKAKFESTKIEKTDKGYTIHGNLTLNGKTKEIAIPAEVTAAGGAVKINGTATIDKRDFGMTYGGGKIDDAVAIKVAVDAK